MLLKHVCKNVKDIDWLPLCLGLQQSIHLCFSICGLLIENVVYLLKHVFSCLQIYNHWLSNIKDWCISRQLWWGHRIPVWYIEGKNREEEYIVARNAREAHEKAQKKYGKDVKISQDPDVLDTWFSRSVI